MLCVVEAIKTNRNLKKHQILNFLKMYIDKTCLDLVFLKALVCHYFDDKTRNKLVDFHAFGLNSSSTHKINNLVGNYNHNINYLNSINKSQPINYYHKYDCYYYYGYNYYPYAIEDWGNNYYYIKVLICDENYKFINSNIETPTNNIRSLSLSGNFYK